MLQSEQNKYPVQGENNGYARTDKKDSDSARDFSLLQNTFQTFLKIQDGHFSIFTESGQILFAPPDFLNFLGFNADEEASPLFFDLYQPGQKETLSKILKSTVTGQPAVLELPLLRKDGRYISARTRLMATPWDGNRRWRYT